MLKEDVNHEEQMANSLNEYKQNGQNLKLVKEARKEIIPILANRKYKAYHSILCWARFSQLPSWSLFKYMFSIA